MTTQLQETVKPELAECPYRFPSGRTGQHICGLIQEITNCSLMECIVGEDACRACCSRGEKPTVEEWNPIIGSWIYKIASRRAGRVKTAFLSEEQRKHWEMLLSKAKEHVTRYGPAKMFYRAVKAGLEWAVRDRFAVVPEEVHAEREKKCTGGEDASPCELWSDGTCLACKCWMKAKLMLPGSVCEHPQGPKWTSVDKDGKPIGSPTAVSELTANVDPEFITKILPPPPQRHGPKVTDWCIVIHCGRREKPTIMRCLDSLLAAGWNARDVIVLFDGEDRFHADARKRGVQVIVQAASATGYGSFLQVLASMVAHRPQAQAFLYVQDDALFPDLPVRAYLEDSVLWPAPQEKVGFISLYGSAQYDQGQSAGWVEFGRRRGCEWSAQAWIFPPPAIYDLLRDGHLWRHRRVGTSAPPRNGKRRRFRGSKHIDTIVDGWRRRSRRHAWVPMPSIVQHIGDTSAMGHGRLRGGRRCLRSLSDVKTSSRLVQSVDASVSVPVWSPITFPILPPARERPAITIVTATGDRQDSFALCEFWMSRQTRPLTAGDVQWIVVDDGTVPTECRMGQEHHRRGPRPKDPPHTLAKNLRHILGEIRGDLVLFVEDDDWYSQDYIERMTKWLENVPLAGERGSKYYHLAIPGYIHFTNHRWVALARTGFVRAKVGDCLRRALKDNGSSVDWRLWKIWCETEKGRHERPVDRTGKMRLHVSLKGASGGRRGCTWSQKQKWGKDPDMRQLLRWTDDPEAVEILRERRSILYEGVLA